MMSFVEGKPLTISMIASVTKDGSIGKDNDLLVHDRHDLKHFKDTTDGCPIVMGRKTFESLPKLLPNRTHIVITRNFEGIKAPKSEPGDPHVIFCTEIEDAMVAARSAAMLSKVHDIYIIGGWSTYQQGMKYAKHCIITHNFSPLTGDAKFPMEDMEANFPLSDQIKEWYDDEGVLSIVKKYSRKD